MLSKAKSIFHFCKKPNFKSTYQTRLPRQFVRDKVIFIHVPKCAGSSFLDSYLGYQLGHTSAEDYYNIDPRFFSSAYVFSFVRHPVYRFISAYNFIQKTTLWTYVPDFKKKVDSFGLSINEVATALTKESAILDLPWFKPQYHYLTINGVVAVNQVFKTENFEQDLEVIKSKTGLKLRICTKINATNKLISNFNEVLSPQSINNLELIYEKDFTLFGYF